MITMFIMDGIGLIRVYICLVTHMKLYYFLLNLTKIRRVFFRASVPLNSKQKC